MANDERTKNSGAEPAVKKTDNDFLLVGIGASAGGIKALTEFFDAAPDNCGMAFVVILHLSDEHESSLAHILQSHTKMTVTQVTHTEKVKINKVYVIPPAKGLALTDGVIKLTEAPKAKGRRVPIDLFFRTLAEAYGDKAVAVILSGTGSDGASGMGRVKENGGIGIVQEPTEAEYDGMPQSAINTGLVDLILPVAEIPKRLMQFVRSAPAGAALSELPASAGGQIAGDTLQKPARKQGRNTQVSEGNPVVTAPGSDKTPDALTEILAIVKARTGHDFSNYKHATILRRIARRMQVNDLAEMPDYLAFVRKHADEPLALQRDLLITVTNFFRNREAFEVLKREIVPKLFSGKAAKDAVRLWSVGCATGDEAYSLAIMLDEYASTLTDAPQISIFASDINESALEKGRDCFYENTIAADVSPERLRRYFTSEGGGYRLRKEIRETVLFAPHNILRDPPFSKLDLVVCRNLLIYFNRETQDKVFGIFNFALKRDGFLFLGNSESADSQKELFSVVDKKHRIYKSRVGPHFQPLPAMPSPGRWNARAATPQLPIETRHEPQIAYGEIHYKLVEQFAPLSVLVDADYNTVHISEHAGRYLHVAPGEPTRDLLKLVDPSLKLDLQSALFAAKKNGFIAEARNVRFVRTASGSDRVPVVQKPARKQGRNTQPDQDVKNPVATAPGSDTAALINITVRLLRYPETADGFYLVIFDESKTTPSAEAAATAPLKGGEIQTADREAMHGLVQQLEKELQIGRDHLRTTIEHNETANEELKASNEELQALNEELRSASEEMETGKEELQSLNEELTTVNAELKDKVDETIRINSDLQNLIQSTDIGTIFLDRALRIKRYTPMVAELFNIIPSDIGRPLEHLTHKIDYDNLTEDAENVLGNLKMQEREVRGGAGDSRYLVRLAPYRTLDDKIDGVVLSFQNITDLKRASDALTMSDEKFRDLADNISQLAWTCDKLGDVTWYNKRWLDYTGLTFEEMKDWGWKQVQHPDHVDRVVASVTRSLEAGEMWEDTFPLRGNDGEYCWFLSRAVPIRDESGDVVRWFGTNTDVTDIREIEQQLRESREELEIRVEMRTAELRDANRRLEDSIAETQKSQEERIGLLKKVLSAQEDERRRIARDMHDHFGQQLTGLRLHLEMLENMCDEPALCDKVAVTQEIAKKLDTDVSFLVWELRPTALDDLGLKDALAHYIDRWAAQFEIPAEFIARDLDGTHLSGDAEISLYRIAQEALNNAYKHAAPTHVSVLLECQNGELTMIIEDNGTGFESDKKLGKRKGLGLVGMRERAALIGGMLQIESAPGRGTTIFVRLPIGEAA